MSRLHPEAPLPVLYQSLCRAGWGALAGREWQGVRSTLNALVQRMRNSYTASADLTAWQVAQSAGLSERWARRCLAILEDLGLIFWQRGVINAGKPMAGFITVRRFRLWALVQEAWARAGSEWAARRARTAARLANLKKPDAYIRRSRRAELNADPLSVKAAAPQQQLPESVNTHPSKDKEMRLPERAPAGIVPSLRRAAARAADAGRLDEAEEILTFIRTGMYREEREAKARKQAERNAYWINLIKANMEQQRKNRPKDTRP